MHVEWINYALGAGAVAFGEGFVVLVLLTLRFVRDYWDEVIALAGLG